MRKLLLLLVCAFVSIGTWAVSLTGGGSYTVAGGIVTFSGTTAGAIAAESSFNFSGATRIKFDNTCEINQADLEKFLQGSTYYVDLFDITNGSSAKMKVDDYTTTADDNNADNIDMIIEKAVADMVTNGWQAKGIILPLNTGSGTTKVEKAMSLYGDTHPTFTEYAVYYRSTQEVAAIYAHDATIKYTYPSSGNTTAQTNFSTAYAHLTAHSEVAADTYIVSTNNDRRLDLSSIPSGKTKISIINDEMVYRSTLANIYVETAEVDKFAEAVANTGIKNTPCELLVVEGPVSGDDVAAVNDFNDSSVQGPKVYNFAATRGATKEMLSTITNGKLEYIVLPNAMATEQIAADDFSDALTASTNTNFKAAIAPSDDSKKLSAYVKEAGSLGMARYYATDGSYNQYITPQYNPYTKGLTDVILTGNLNASDINSNGNVGADGHWSNSNVSIAGLNGEAATLKTFDLEKAVFADNYDMNLSTAGYEKLTNVILPTSESMTIIPHSCLYNNPGIQELCVPYNYSIIEDQAFLGTSISHITTTDAIGGAVVDNGPLTYTLSANLTQLGIKPNPVTNAISGCVFPVDQGVLDIYSMATKTPKCYKGVFPGNSCYGNGGFLHDVPYCRDKYYNGSDKKKSLAVLHFPSKETFDKATVKEPTGYEDMKKFYTDVNKNFTKLEQTGAVDANGESITWPTQEEMYRTYNQASLGLTWNDWVETYTMADVPQVCGGQPAVALNNGVYSKNDQPDEGEHGGDYPFDEYAGWHQLVLSQATYYEPAEKIEDEKVIREYEEAGWYTICIPFNLSIKQAREWLGVPKSEGNVICKLDGEEVTSPIMPDIRQLYSVGRVKGGTTKDAKGNVIKQNMVYLRMTTNLWDGSKAQYLEFNLDAASDKVIKYTDAHTSGTTTVDDDNFMIGGRPYIIKAYKRKGETISRQNIGKLIMTRYVDQLDASASCVENGLFEQLGTGNLLTLRFAKPYENHKVQAMNENPAALGYMTYEDDGENKRYFYTMVGQFWTQPLPQYCLYMSHGSWYRYADVPANVSQRYTWDPYKCIIMPTVEIADTDHPKSGGYRDNSEGASNYPQPVEGTTDKLESEFKLQFLDGRNDDDFTNYTASKYVFVFDDEGVTEWDENGMVVSAIDSLDGEDLTVATDSKMYNVSGQYVGNSLEGLSKGMYIVNGKKFIVK